MQKCRFKGLIKIVETDYKIAIYLFDSLKSVVLIQKNILNYFNQKIFANKRISFIFAPAFSRDVRPIFGEVAQLVRAQDS